MSPATKEGHADRRRDHGCPLNQLWNSEELVTTWPTTSMSPGLRAKG